MAISVVQTKSATGSGSPLTATLASSTTAGNCLVVCIMNYGGAAATVTGVTIGGSASNFTQVKAAAGTGAFFTNVWIWVCPNCPGGQTAISVTAGGAGFAAGGGGASLVAYEVSGLALTSPLDQSDSGNGSSSSWSSGASGTISQAAEFVAGCAAGAFAMTGPSSPWVNTTPGTGTIAGQQVTSSAGTYTYSGTASGSDPWAAAVITLLSPGAAVAAAAVGQVVQQRPARRILPWMHGRAGAPVSIAGPPVAPPPPASAPVRQHRPARPRVPWMRGKPGTPWTAGSPPPPAGPFFPLRGPVRQKRPGRRSPVLHGTPGTWTATPGGVVNQWAGTFSQPATFANMPPALESVVVPLTPAASVGAGAGYATAGNWLFAIVGSNQDNPLPEVTFGDADDIHSYWRPMPPSPGGGNTRISVWYTANLARVPQFVYVAPNGAASSISVLVVEVGSLGPWDAVTGISSGYAAGATSLNLALPAPGAQSFVLAAACGDLAGAGQALAPSGWTSLATVTASDGSDHNCDCVLTAASLGVAGAASAVSVNATATSATDLSGVIIAVQLNAPSPIPGGANPAWPGVMVLEAGFGSGYETPPDQIGWTNLGQRFWGWKETTGVQYELGQIQTSDLTITLDSSDGGLSPVNPGSPYYSNALNLNMSFNAVFPYQGIIPWTPVNGAVLAQDGTYSFASAPNAQANYSCKVTPNGTTATPGLQSEQDPVTAGSVYSASAWFYSPAGWGTGAQVAIRWWNASNAVISTSTVAATAIPAATWTQVTQLAVTAPAGAVGATVIPQLAGVPAAPFWTAEAAIVPGAAAVSTGLITTGVPVRLRIAIGTIGGVTLNRWYVISRNASKWPEQRNNSQRGYAAMKAADLWAVMNGSLPTPYRAEVETDNPGWWWPGDDAPGPGGILPVQLLNAAVGNTQPLSILLSGLGGVAQQPYNIDGEQLGTGNTAPVLPVYQVRANEGWMTGDPQSGLQSQQTGGAVTQQPGSAAWQQSGAAGDTGSYGFYLACSDTFPALSGGVTVEAWASYPFWGTSTVTSAAIHTVPTLGQPYSPLTILALATAGLPVAVLQLDMSGHLNLVTYNGSNATNHSIYATSDLRNNVFTHYALAMTATGWTVYVNGGVTATVSGTAAGMSNFTWLLLNGDTGVNGGGASTHLENGGNVSVSHVAVYPQILPVWRIQAHYWAAITGFGQLPAPQQVQPAFIVPASSATPDGSLQGDQIGAYGYTSPHVASISALVTAVCGPYTSGPSAWAVTSQYGQGEVAWVGWTGLAPLFRVYTSANLGAEAEASTAAGAGDSYLSGYGSSASGRGFCHVGSGDGSSPPAAGSSVGDTVDQRIERLCGSGRVTVPLRAIDKAPNLVQAALDTGGQQAGQAIANIQQSDGGMLAVDNGGVLFYRTRGHLASDTMTWQLGPNVAAGQYPFNRDVTFESDPQRVYDAITITPYAPDGSNLPVITPAGAAAVNAAQAQFGNQPLNITSYLQSTTEQQNQANWSFQWYGVLRRRISSLTVDAAAHPAAWPFVVGANISDLVQVTDTPIGAPATVGLYRITNITRNISFGANGSTVVGSITVTADPEPGPSVGYWA